MTIQKNGDSTLITRESRHFLKGISSKLILAVLVAVIIPFFGLVYFIDTQIDTRLKENIVRQSLLGVAGDLAGKIDKLIRDCNTDMGLLASSIFGDAAINEYLSETKNQRGDKVWRKSQTDLFNQHIRFRQVYDLILLVGPDGKLVTCSTINLDGTALGEEIVRELYSLDFSKESWYKEALAGDISRKDKHKSPYLTGPNGSDLNALPETLYHIGFAVPVKSFSPQDRYSGVLYSLVNWRHIQELVDVPGIKSYFNGLVKDKEPSPYAWIWGADANTILAHKNRKLYGLKVNGPEINLPQMVEDGNSSFSGHYREYSYLGVMKNASYHHCKGPSAGPLDGGFGWLVGVGIDNTDIFAMSSELSQLLYTSTGIVIVLVIIWTMAVARRTTKPILTLQKHIGDVSNGNLEERVHINTGDEINDLADDFNLMIQELKEKRAQLIKAEKNAAWKEMAQQISHDIKNTLTPIMLSIDLLKQSALDHSPNYQEILQQTLTLIDNQVGNLQQISSNFYEFTGGRKSKLCAIDLSLVLAQVLQLNRAWAEELNIRIVGLEALTDENRIKVVVMVDDMKFHRLLTNLVSNAFQAMPDGGILSVKVSAREGWAILEIIDSGIGIPDDVREHLFEPYFTTRSKGTGLGLAIAKRVVEETNGTITLEPNFAAGVGTVAHIRLPIVLPTDDHQI
jgi:signal transduction histidine kinase